MNDLRLLIKRYCNSGIIIDTNLLFLYLVGLFDVNLVPENKRLQMYEKEDYYRLKKFLKNFKDIFLTPHILTEISHFSFNIPKNKLSAFLDDQIVRLNNFTEKFIEKKIIFQNKAFKVIGVTDTSIIQLAKDKRLLVITDDFRAFSFILNQKVDAINYNHIRNYYLQPGQ